MFLHRVSPGGILQGDDEWGRDGRILQGALVADVLRIPEKLPSCDGHFEHERSWGNDATLQVINRVGTYLTGVLGV